MNCRCLSCASLVFTDRQYWDSTSCFIFVPVGWNWGFHFFSFLDVKPISHWAMFSKCQKLHILSFVSLFEMWKPHTALVYMPNPVLTPMPNAVNGESQGTLCSVRRLFAQLLSFQIVPTLAAAAPPPPPPPPSSSPPPAAQNLCLVKQSKIPSLSAQSLSRTLQVTLFQTLYLGWWLLQMQCKWEIRLFDWEIHFSLWDFGTSHVCILYFN